MQLFDSWARQGSTCRLFPTTRIQTALPGSRSDTYQKLNGHFCAFSMAWKRLSSVLTETSLSWALNTAPALCLLSKYIEPIYHPISMHVASKWIQLSSWTANIQKAHERKRIGILLLLLYHKDFGDLVVILQEIFWVWAEHSLPAKMKICSNRRVATKEQRQKIF